MSDAPLEPRDVPTFGECVVGYRAWALDGQDQLWPLTHLGGLPEPETTTQPGSAVSLTRGGRRVFYPNGEPRPWQPGVNTSRCNCPDLQGTRYGVSWDKGRRVIQPSPGHEAPAEDCACGLYSWRRPVEAWAHDPRACSAGLVAGAVAAWGHMQVCREGFRAEHARVVALAYPPAMSRQALVKVRRAAARYRVDLVALDELQRAASGHGTPLPDAIGQGTDSLARPSSTDLDVSSLDWHVLVSDRAPDA
ncbi:MAG TPA: hypothetical protein VMU55_09210, partial [Solirubrobacteraceae bacterium]|nr:hypothetical protein [Solirubrobacteraceae bacterium]